jgi:hypothetical protein
MSNFIRTSSEFSRLTFSLAESEKAKGLRNFISKEKAKEILEHNSECLSIFELAEIAANGGMRCDDGKVLFAEKI